MKALSSLSVALLVTAGCGGASPNGVASPGAAPKSTEESGGVEGKLQGTWEIVRYESRDPIPNEAMPLMGELFENLRVSVHDSAWSVEGKDSPFHVVHARGDSFELDTGGMFDKATCRLNSRGEWEVDDRGPTWPGKTVLRRAK